MSETAKPAGLLREAERLRQCARLQEAEALCRRVLASAPDSAGAYQTLSLIALAVGKPEQAAGLMAKAADLAPRVASFRRNLCEMYRRLGRLPEALAQGREAVRLDPGDAVAWYNFGVVLGEQGSLEEARDAYARAVEIDPRHHLAWNNLGAAKNQLGDEAGALAAYLAAAGIEPAHAEAQNNAAAIYIERGELDEARPRLRLAIAARPDFLEAHQNLSTLIEQVLSSHPRMHGAGEFKDFRAVLKAHPKAGPMERAADWVPGLTEADYREIGAAYLERLHALDTQALRITDKMPGNFHYLGFLCRALPGARIVHSMRDPMDSCLSNYTRLFKDTMEFACDLGELGRYYNRYIRLMQHWERILPPGRVLHLPYERMVADLPGQARRLIAHAGLDWDDACLAFYENRRRVRTASVAQVREPIYSSSVARWAHYGDGLAGLRAIVGTGYPHGFASAASPRVPG